MGIKELWTILQPYCERKPLYELEGKVVAIDLAGWVCESLCVVDYVVQPRFYLRNLFFRTCYLLLSGVTPVFVLEGDAPPLKYGVICKRNELQFRGARPRNVPTQSERTQKNSQVLKKPDKGRSRFNYVLKQCEELIASMGLQCVQGPGEAEQFCAFLNEDRMVDGVISQDSDCFAYGARRVYRNFSVSSQGAVSAQGGAVDVYDIDNVQASMDFGRNKMIVLALLCGCDYNEGVNGVGKEAAMKLLNQYSEKDILTRVKSWRSIDKKYTSLEIKVDDKSYCVNCGHHGRAQNHSKNGCKECRMDRGCDASIWKEQRMAIKSELQIRKKAMTDPDFPSQTIIDEFLNRPISLPKLDLNWKQPSVVKFLRFMSQLLQWEEIYCFQKFLPLLTRWQLFHYGSGNNNLPMKGNVSPDYIKKKRTPKGIASYEIIWKDDDKCFKGLIPEEQIAVFVEQNSSLEHLWSTVEPVDLVQKAYPDVVSNYLDTIAAKNKKPPKAAKTGQKSTRTTRKKLVDVNGDKNEENVDSELLKKSKKIVRKKDGTTKTKNIDEFFKKVKSLPRISSPEKNEELQSPKIKTCATPLSLTELSFDFNNSNDEVQDLSDIIHGIVSNSPTLNDLCGRKLFYESVNDQPSSSTPFACNVEQDEKDETADEFDMIVAGKKPIPIRNNTPTTSRRKSNRSSALKRHSPENVNDPSHSSTPILIKKFFKRNCIDLKGPEISSTPASPINLSFESIAPVELIEPSKMLSTPTSPKNFSFESIRSTKPNNVSHFFCDLTDENDEFEKLLDFRNMKDDVSSDNEEYVPCRDEDNVPCRDDKLQDVNDSLPIQLSETFDLDDYVPVSANLKKRIASY